MIRCSLALVVGLPLCVAACSDSAGGTSSPTPGGSPTSSSPGYVPYHGSVAYADLALGGTHGCALLPVDAPEMASTAVCWGPSYDDSWSSGYSLGSLGGGIELTAGMNSTCFVDDVEASRALSCFGISPGMVPQSWDPGFAGIRAAANVTCVLDSQKRAVCWGQMFGSGAFTSPDTEPLSEVMPMDASGGATSVCGLRAANSSPICWNLNHAGTSLGVSPNLAMKTLIKASSGIYMCGVRASDSTLACWVPDTENWGGKEMADGSGVPAKLEGLRVRSGEIWAVNGNGCFLLEEDSTPRCFSKLWEEPNSDELWIDWENGLGMVGSQVEITLVPTPTKVPLKRLSLSGAGYACGLRQEDGTLLCWGDHRRFEPYFKIPWVQSHEPAP